MDVLEGVCFFLGFALVHWLNLFEITPTQEVIALVVGLLIPRNW
jgi:hypothetical protein